MITATAVATATDANAWKDGTLKHSDTTACCVATNILKLHSFFKDQALMLDYSLSNIF